jgi:hypothetical protein
VSALVGKTKHLTPYTYHLFDTLLHAIALGVRIGTRRDVFDAMQAKLGKKSTNLGYACHLLKNTPKYAINNVKYWFSQY